MTWEQYLMLAINIDIETCTAWRSLAPAPNSKPGNESSHAYPRKSVQRIIRGSREAESVDLVRLSDRSVARFNGWANMDRFRSTARCSLRTCR